MSEDTPDIHIPNADEAYDTPQYYGPPPPSDREAAKFMTHEDVAFALYQRRLTNRSLIETNDKLEQLKFDKLTGLLNRGPGEEQAEELIHEIHSRNVDSPNALMLLMVDVKGLHDINANHGHQVGDEVISATADQLKIVANLLSLVLRTHDRRHSSSDAGHGDHRQGERRHGQGRDIVWRRGGDEFVVVLPFSESESITKDLVKQVITERLDHPERYVAEDTPEIRWGAAFYDPDSQPDMTAKQVIKYLEENADPKGDGQSSRQAAA